MRTTAEVVEEIRAQPVLQPGEPGWWKVWGGTVRDILPGDFVVTSSEEFYVQGTYTAKSVAKLGIVVDGEEWTIGKMAAVKVLRRSTRNLLSEYVR